MTILMYFHLHPGAFASVGVGADDISGIVDCVLACSPERVRVSGFDQTSAAAIADRLVALGMTVHVEGSGIAEWRTPEGIYDALMARLNPAPETPNTNAQ